jgi:transcriptional regulator with XRE-family HTH domain
MYTSTHNHSPKKSGPRMRNGPGKAGKVPAGENTGRNKSSRRWIMNTLHSIVNKEDDLAPFRTGYTGCMELKDIITRARLSAGLSKSELARAVGVDPSAIGHLESGRQHSLSGGLLVKMSRALGIPAENLSTGKVSLDADFFKPRATVEPPRPNITTACDTLLDDLAVLPPERQMLIRAELGLEAAQVRLKIAKEAAAPPHTAPKGKHSRAA